MAQPTPTIMLTKATAAVIITIFLQQDQGASCIYTHRCRTYVSVSVREWACGSSTEGVERRGALGECNLTVDGVWDDVAIIIGQQTPVIVVRLCRCTPEEQRQQQEDSADRSKNG